MNSRLLRSLFLLLLCMCGVRAQPGTVTVKTSDGIVKLTPRAVALLPGIARKRRRIAEPVGLSEVIELSRIHEQLPVTAETLRHDVKAKTLRQLVVAARELKAAREQAKKGARKYDLMMKVFSIMGRKPVSFGFKDLLPFFMSLIQIIDLAYHLEVDPIIIEAAARSIARSMDSEEAVKAFTPMKSTPVVLEAVARQYHIEHRRVFDAEGNPNRPELDEKIDKYNKLSINALIEYSAGKIQPGDFSGYGLTSLEGMVEQPFLRELNFQHNSLTSLKGMVRQRSLMFLHLHYNSLTSLEGMVEQPRLTILDLRYNGLTSLKGMVRQPNLENLYLANNGLTSLEGMVRQPELYWLNLQHNGLTSLKGMVEQPKLNRLYLEGNQLGPDTIDEIRSKLPEGVEIDVGDQRL